MDAANMAAICLEMKIEPVATQGTADDEIPSPTYIIHEPEFKRLIGDAPKLEVIQAQETKFAHEAGVYLRSENKEYFTSNYQSGRQIDVYAIDCASLEIERIKPPHVVNANGACKYLEGVLFCSQGDLVTPSALVLVHPQQNRSAILLNTFHGRQFNSINDVVIHHDTGDIWFTDPTYGYEQAFRPLPVLPSQVYRFRPATGQVWCVADGFEQCNGLCFSPDYSKIYITDTGANQAHGTPGNGHNIWLNPRLPSTIYVYDVVDNGKRLANRRVFAYCSSGVPDGIKCDRKGNVYSGCGDGVHVWNTDGTLIGKIYVGSVVGNFNFSDRGIWIMAEERLLRAEIEAYGALLDRE